MSKSSGFYPTDDWRTTQGWGENPQDYAGVGQLGHNGYDSPEAIGTPIHPFDDGVVEFAGWGGNHPWLGAIAGYTVLVRHRWGYSSYNHQSKVLARVGDKVTPNTVIGLSGQSGWATGPHTHADTMPLRPNFGNGFAGRVNPATLINLSPRGASRLGENIVMNTYDRTDTSKKRIAKAGRVQLSKGGKPLSLISTAAKPAKPKTTPYLIDASIEAEGFAEGDQLLIYLTNEKGSRISPRRRVSAQRNGLIQETISTKVMAKQGDVVYLELYAASGNQTGTVTRMESSAWLLKAA